MHLNLGTRTSSGLVIVDILFFPFSFSDEYNKIGPMKMSQLSVLETIQEVSDFVQIQANDKEFRNLSILRNLRVIHGRRLDSSRASLQIFKTSLEVLGFESLREVKHGTIYVANNSRLCYASSVNWDRIRESEKQKVIVEHNRNSTSCGKIACMFVCIYVCILTNLYSAVAQQSQRQGPVTVNVDTIRFYIHMCCNYL